MAINPIEILKDTIDSVSHTVTITSIVSLGSSKYQLNSANTFYLRTAGKPKTITIDAVEYVITDFVINSYITVIAADGTDQAVSASSFTISPPLFVWGNPQMVSAELVKRMGDGTVVWPYMWIVEIGGTDGTLDPAAAVTETRNFQIFFLDSADKVNWTIEQHYDNDIYTLNNYIEYFFTILKSRRDLFETDSITYSKDNYINFGDYIVDEGMKQHILNGEVTGIQLQISIPFILGTCTDATFLAPCPDVTTSVESVDTAVDTASGQNIDIQIVDTGGTLVPSTLITNTANTKKLEVSTAGDPVANSMNAAALTDAVAGTTKTFVITYADLSAVVVTETSDSPTAFVGTVPLPANPTVYFRRDPYDWKTSEDTWDEGWQYLNAVDTYTVPIGGKTQELDPDNQDKILWADSPTTGFTHLFRLISVTGGYYDDSDSTYYDSDGVASTYAAEFETLGTPYLIDRLTGYGWRGTRGGTKNYASALTDADSFSQAGFSDWFLPTRRNLMTLTRGDIQQSLYITFRPPINIQLNLWSCTPYPNAPTTTMWVMNANNNFLTLAKSTSYTVSYKRLHYT